MAADDYLRIIDELKGAGDELILLRYLKPMIDNGASWPQLFFEDANVFNKNPSKVFKTVFVIVKPRTEACGKTDGCDYGRWRIMAGDKMIKNEETGKLLGFKKILKYCIKKTTRAREYKRSWVMEEYRLPSKWNPKQDHVICKVRLLFQTEIRSLLSKHFSYSSGPLPATTRSLPAYGYRLPNGGEVGAYYLQHLVGHENEWPSHVTNDVYCMHPSALVDPYQDQMFARFGLCIFANRTEACGYTDGGCDSGCWRIMKGDKPISSITVMGETFGYMRVFKFCEVNGKPKYFYTDPDGEVVWMTWIMEEYRLAEEVMKGKVLCVIKFQGRR